MSNEGISGPSKSPQEKATEFPKNEVAPTPEAEDETFAAPNPVVAERTAADAVALNVTRERLGLAPLEPTADELEKVEKATKEADPTTYSPLSLADSPEQIGVALGGNEIVASGDERYIHIDQKPERQQAVARMLKGILNVSDIVKSGEGEAAAYYSKEMPLDRVRQETSLEEVSADHFILKQVFGDFDHAFSTDKINNIARKSGRSVYYDFGNASPLDNDASYSFAQLNPEAEALSSNEAEIILQKLSSLQDRFSGVEGKQFIDTVVAASGMEPAALFGLYDFEIPDLLKQTGSDVLGAGAIQNRLLTRIDTVRKSVMDSVPPPLPSEET